MSLLRRGKKCRCETNANARRPSLSAWYQRPATFVLALIFLFMLSTVLPETSRAASVPAKINFQPGSASVPSGYLADVGAGFNDARGFGWVWQASLTSATHTRLDLSLNARDRNLEADQRLDTLIHMQYPTAGTYVNIPGAWEYALANGTYAVTVAVGDGASGADAESHTINVEGVNAIKGFVPSGSTRHRTVTVTVAVKDGRLTIDAVGGTNTKINYLEIAASTSAPPPAPSSGGAERMGFAAGGGYHALSATELARTLDAYKTAGARWIRFDINWSVVQWNGSTSYNWAPFDRVVDAASVRGLRVLGLLVQTPPWARSTSGDSYQPPADLNNYSRFAKAAVQRYVSKGVRHWEIWNEPNYSTYWAPAPDAARYTAMLKLAYSAIKSADPGAFVVTGGLAPWGAYGEYTSLRVNPLNFLERMYAAGAAGSFDAVGWHPYTVPAGIEYHTWSAWSQMSETNPSALSMMSGRGDGAKQIWATEMGAPTGGPNSISESGQAQHVTDVHAKWQTLSWGGPMFWHSLRDRATNSSSREDNFGLLRTDWSWKPGYNAYRQAAGK